MSTVARKQQFICGGCGAVKRGMVNVPHDKVHDPVSAPPGWYMTSATAQHPASGAIGTLTIFACSEGCAKKMAEDGGAAATMLADFKRFYAPREEVVPPSTTTPLVTP
jgi:hypothetical protein